MKEDTVVVEFPLVWFKIFEKWFSNVRISDVPTSDVVAIHRCYVCVLESKKEVDCE